MTVLLAHAATRHHVELALSAGADGLILEHGLLAIRAYETTSDDPTFSMIRELADWARRIKPDVKLTFNIDMLVHDGHFELIARALGMAQLAGVTRFRVQDIGLVSLIRSLVPDAQVVVAPEIGHHSEVAMRYWLNQADGHAVSNDVPATVIQNLSDVSDRLSIQVQGPVLIQYSTRRYMAGVINSDENLVRRAADLEYPTRFYRFLDTPNGHCMFLYFDRCLLKDTARLMALNLGEWVVDTRGESDAYLTHAISAYRTVLDTGIAPPDALGQLESISGRPQRPGFFRGNATDQDRDRHLTDRTVIAVVREVVKPNYIVLEIKKRVDVLPESVTIITPTKKAVTTALHRLRDVVTLDPVTSLDVDQLAVMDWVSGGIVAKSMVVL